MGYAELQLKWYKLTLEVVATRISEQRNISVNSEDVGRAIAELNDFSQNLQVFWHVLNKGLSIYDELINFSFSLILGEIYLFNDECIYPNGIPVDLYEKQIKVKGQKWEVHKNDEDPFPSDPHAHNYETGLKLDLTNGKLYKKKQEYDSISKKKLKQIRKKFQEVGVTMPKLMI